MKERSEMVAWIRGEIVGPSRLIRDPAVIPFTERSFEDPEPLRRGPVVWRPAVDAELEEVLYFDQESPHRKYGAGLLHPEGQQPSSPDEAAMDATDTVGAEPPEGDERVEDEDQDGNGDQAAGETPSPSDEHDHFDITGVDVLHPSTMGISFCAKLEERGQIILRLPRSRRFNWQTEDDSPFPLNGRYELCTRRWIDQKGVTRDSRVWRRVPGVPQDAFVTIKLSELAHKRVLRKPLAMPDGYPLRLRFEVYPHKRTAEGSWLLTVVLRNCTPLDVAPQPRELILYQTFFDARVEGGRFEEYPESRRPFADLDADEQSLALLYRESATWAIGHGCAGAWECETDSRPSFLFADVLPAVQLPSMTPDILLNGSPTRLSMRVLAELSQAGEGAGWEDLDALAEAYGGWIRDKTVAAKDLPAHLADVAGRHLEACSNCHKRITDGISLLRKDARVLRAFRLANLAMLLQQIATKQLLRRRLAWDDDLRVVAPDGSHKSPWGVFQNREEDKRLGSWRAFQIAFLLMSLEGVRTGNSPDRDLVDLIWFPTGGGKTEAYLAVLAFFMFHERFLMESDRRGPRRDGTNALMRYTLRMLTTQQFQRAASLVCAMEYLRQSPSAHGLGNIPGQSFSLGLWIGGEGSPNKIRDARAEINKFRRGTIQGNPLILTECPWCRAEIGRYDGKRPTRPNIPDAQWNGIRLRGIVDDPQEGPRLQCTDPNCFFGTQFEFLPVEVIDQRIYAAPPSLVIATADKLAMVAYRPEAGALFGRRLVGDQIRQDALPPGLIIQDELHLISGPLGTMYALYEGIFERLCSYEQDGRLVKPKLIASTATIRGAAEQVRALWARQDTRLFPSPGLVMGDSFFGRYARDSKGDLLDGRLYLGIHASDYGSILTTQVRAFSAALFRPWLLAPDRRDPWWTLLAFYNSIRELAGAQTLFHSDIRSRLKFMFNREGYPPENRRNLQIVEELTSRLSQAEIVGMMDRLGLCCTEGGGPLPLDACLASSIIEVGVDIDRLSLMGVVGQPKTTATYIQVTGRIGRKWWERPGLVLTIYNPSKSRDRSHFEQFHSYHRRLYERVEPTTATPFAISAIQRGLPGALITWARQHSNADVQNSAEYEDAVEAAYRLLHDRCKAIQAREDILRSLQEMDRVRADLDRKWSQHPQEWEKFPPALDGEYLMLWPGQFSTPLQRRRGVTVPTSMRQVDRSAELIITSGYTEEDLASSPAPSASPESAEQPPAKTPSEP